MFKKIVIGIISVFVILLIAYIGLTLVYPFVLQKINPAPKKVSFVSYRDVNGKKIDLAKLKGKPLILFFFIADCPYCDDEIPKWTEYYKKVDNSKITIIGVLYSPKKVARTAAKKIVAKKKIKFPVILDENRKISKNYEVTAYPWVIRINKQGKIITKNDELYDDIKSILKKYLREK